MKIAILITLFLGSYSLFGQANDNKIYYSFSDTIKSMIEKVMIEKDIKKETGYIIFSELSNGNKGLLLNDCDKCPIFKLIKKSNRYAKLKGFEIPIIFSADLIYTVIASNKKNRALLPNIGGWLIEITVRGEVEGITLIQ
jgi:hypothetical protein